MSNSAQLRRQFFDQGAEAFAAHVEYLGLGDDVPSGRWYPCPLCMTLFDDDELRSGGHLSLEHAPQASVGGVEILLTCRTCNNAAGTGMDAEVAKLNRIRNVVTGESPEVIPGRIHLPNTEAAINAVLSTSPGRREWIVDHQHNNPSASAHFKELLDNRLHEHGQADLNFTANLTIDDHLQARAWIRSAYLAGFAVLGWPYAAREVMDDVRARLVPDSLLEPDNYFFDAATANLRRRHILVVDRPAECQSVLFHWDGHVVVTPALRGSRPLQEILEAMRTVRTQSPGSAQLEGASIPWPSRHSERFHLCYQARRDR